MESRITSNHFDDANGNPAGGSTYGNGFSISWQNGPLGRGEDRIEPNGAFVEDIIKAAMDRIDYYQRSKFWCERNQNARKHLDKALYELNQRTREREERNVEGTHAA